LLSAAFAVGSAIAVAGVLIQLSGVNAVEGIVGLVESAFGSYQRLGFTMTRMAPLLFTGLSVVVAFKSGVFNIGAEGQYILGGLTSVLVATSNPTMPSVLAIPLVIIAGFLGGAAWSFIPAVLKAKQNVNELLSSLLMNYIALYLMQYLLRDGMQDRSIPVRYPVTAAVPAFAMLPTLLPGTTLTAAIFIALAAAVATYVGLHKTTFGFKIRAVGKNPDASAFSGISVNLTQFSAILISGGLAGLAGFVEAVGYLHKVNMQFSVGYGYTAILLALMSQLNALTLIVVSLFFAGLDTGSQGLKFLGISSNLSVVIEGVLILIILLVRPEVQGLVAKRRRNN
jgi:simple sugar transport system permease protein